MLFSLFLLAKRKIGLVFSYDPVGEENVGQGYSCSVRFKAK